MFQTCGGGGLLYKGAFTQTWRVLFSEFYGGIKSTSCV